MMQIIDSKINIKDIEEATNIRESIQISFKFTDNIYTYEYLGLREVLSEMGGVEAFVLICGEILSIVVILHYMWGLASIIKKKYKYNCNYSKVCRILYYFD